MQTSERVVIVKGDASKWYSQAVFFVNPNAPENKIPKDFVAEAENIIFNYMAKKQKNMEYSIPAYMDYYTPSAILTVPAKHAKKRERHGLILYALMTAACIALAVIFAFGLLS